MRGRRPSPPHLRIVKGTERAGRTATPVPRASGGQPVAPAHLTPSQRALWNEALKNAAPGQLRASDSGVLAAWCVHTDLGRIARQMLGTELVIESPTGVLKQHPCLSIINQQAALAMRAADALGFSPASRPRLNLAPRDAAPYDDEFFPRR